MQPAIRLWFLGTPRSESAGQATQSFESRKAFVLLAYLASQGTALPRTQFASLFWPEQDDERARGNLRRLLYNITSILPGCIDADRQTVRLNDCWIDTRAFEEQVAQGTLTSLSNAAELYRSSFLDGLYLDDCPEIELWLAQQRERWHERAAHALTELTARARERREWIAGLRSVDRLLVLDPWREAAHRDKMRLLALSGQRDSALAHYEICRRILAEELGLDPALETTALYEQIRDGAFAPATTSTLTTTPARRSPIPIAPTPLLGRANEFAWITQQLGSLDCRLMTLVGPGGIGKTRLAIEIANHLRDDFADVCFVDLTIVDSAERVTTAIARTLDVRETEDQPLLASIKAALREQPILLVLDNFEHVISAAPLVAELLANCPQLTILVTSRQDLRLRGEQIFPVPPLALPTDQSQSDLARIGEVAAVALFVARARQHAPDFALTAENAADVAAICRRLDGLPLAIELAAARIRLFPPAALLQRLSNRLGVLTHGPHDLPTRQQTLQNTLDWSYNLLEFGEQTMFARLGIFVGGWTLDAAEEICAEPTVFDALQGLLDKQLIRSEQPLEGEPRFTMLETMREYARVRLAQQNDAPLTHRRHALYYLALVERAAPPTQERPDSARLADLASEYSNQLAALQWLLHQADSELSLRLCNGLAHLWELRGQLSEARHWLYAALALPNGQPSIARASALETAGRLAAEQNDWASAADLLAQALTLGRTLGATRHIAQFLRAQGWFALVRRDYQAALPLFDESLALYRSIDDKPGVSRVLSLQGQIAFEQCAFDRAIPLLLESIALLRTLGDEIDAAWSLNKLGLIALQQGDVSAAERQIQEVLTIFRKLNHVRGISWILGDLGWVRLAQGDFAQAAELFTTSLRDDIELGEKRNIASCLERLACLANAQGQLVRAARLFGAAAGLRALLAIPTPAVVAAQFAPYLGQLRATLDADRLAVAWADGAAMPVEHAVAYALEGP